MALRNGVRLARALRRLLFAALLLAAPASAAGAQQRGDFYDPSGIDLSAFPPGGLIRYAPLPGAPQGAAAWRVLYRSTGLKGEAIAVSGVGIVPAAPAPPGGRPIVAWAHPTTGVVTPCAPSLARVFFQSVQGLKLLLAEGDLVAATDYPGLGGPGVHPYLVGDSEGRAVLDSARAVRQLPGAEASARFAVWGHSQGGQAALFAGILARSYAPELVLVGVAAAAPATELKTLVDHIIDTPGGRNLTAITLWSWQRVFGAPMARLVRPDAVPAVDRLASLCIERVFDLLTRRGPTKALERSFLKVDTPTRYEPWRDLMLRNTPGALPPEVPVFLAQGDRDGLVPPFATRAYMRRLCAAGSAVALDIIPGVGHAFSGRDSAAAAAAWMADRFAGRPAPNDCVKS